MNTLMKQIVRQMPMTFGLMIMMMGLVFLYKDYTEQQKYREFGRPPEISYMQLVSIIAIGAGAAVMAVGVFQYLQGGRAGRDEYSDHVIARSVERSLQNLAESNDVALLKINQMVSNFEKRIEDAASPKVDFTKEEKERILTTLIQSVKDSMTSDFVKAIDDVYAKQIIKSKQWDKLLADLNIIRERLLREVGDLSRRANVNLVIGVGTTVLAVIGLLYVAFGNTIDLSNTPSGERISKILFYYIPRLSLIIFVEVFAYFFLRLYKAGLSDIKFYQNELTNVEVRMTALESSFMFEDKDMLTLVIGELSKTERNFILKKDETTVELEKLKTDSINAKDWLEQITSLLKAKSS